MEPERVPIPVDTAAPGGTTNAYVLGSDRAVLIDPAAETDTLDAVLDGRQIDTVLVTHAHPDHVGGVARYADRGATVLARAGYEDRFERATGVVPDDTVRDGATIETDVGTVRVASTPGHAPDHVALAFDGGILVGDLAIASGSVVVGSGEGDMRGYLTALRRLHARDPERLYPGHGPAIDEPRTVLERLLTHRLDRETAVLRAVIGGAETVTEITDAAYEKDVSGVRGLAEATVEAHLEKLAVEERVAWDGVRASAREAFLRRERETGS
ncbi:MULTISPECIES: MBL fold metallo-hydrolase [Halococcus]|uniref:Beta-lactamase n=1 Tax=Halococcus salifodinae DSM 8989 TaxID=1227456 RepID=M0MY89_9EURY|nr:MULTISPECIES: MBL fold metallo-hydrolase [Halococcus]EMA49819.1 beta-lactamase [Halococcus salifodinae DSM 8989]